VKRKSRIAGQILQVDYDRVLDLSDEECCFSLTQKEIAMILSQTQYFGWSTRWNSVSETEINQDTIDALKSGLERKLMSGCCPDEGKIFRYLPDGTLQSSSDGGVTWADDPGADPRLSAPLAPGLPGAASSAKRCAAADNIRDQFKLMRDNTISLLEGGTTALAIVAGLVGLIAFILSISVVATTFGVLLFGLSAALLSMTPEAVAAAIDDTALEQFKCLVFCYIDEDGRFAPGKFDNLLTDITATFSGFPETFFYSITSTMQATGLSNAAALGVSTADDCDTCDDCLCPHEDDVAIGTFIEIGDDVGGHYIKIASAFATWEGTPANWAVLGNGGMCCTYHSFEVTSGSISSGGLFNCAGDPTGGGAVGRVEFYSTVAPFTIKYYMGG
jgi:hypothetical protein